MTSIDSALGRSAAPIPRMAWVLGLAAAVVLSVGTLFLPTVQQQLAWGALAALAFAAIPLLWREGYTWVILWVAPISVIEPLSATTILAGKYVLAALTAGIAIGKRLIEKEDGAGYDQAPVRVTLLILGWYCIRGVTGDDPVKGIVESLRVLAIAGIAYLWLTQPLRSGGRRRWLYVCLTIALIEAAVTLFQALGLGYFRSRGTFDNANWLGQYLMLMITLALAAALWAPERRAKWLSRLAVPVLSCALFMTGSRAAWLSTLVTCVAAALAARAWRLILLGTALLGMLAVIYVQNPVVRYTMGTVLRFESGLSERDVLWKAAERAWARSPLIGYGPESAGHEMQKEARYPTETDRRLVAVIVKEGSVHSFYRQVLVTTGLIGLALVLWLMFLFLRQAYRRLSSRDPWRRVYGLALMAVTIGMFVHFFFERSVFLGLASSSVLYWFIVTQTLRADDPEYGSS